MNIYVWRTYDGVSIDGTSVVVLAETVEQARQLVREAAERSRLASEAARGRGEYAPEEYWTEVDDEPTRVLPVDTPTVVEFNFGGIE